MHSHLDESGGAYSYMLKVAWVLFPWLFIVDGLLSLWVEVVESVTFGVN